MRTAVFIRGETLNPLSAKFIKWSNTLKQIVGKLPTICLNVFDHFSGLALKGLMEGLEGGAHFNVDTQSCGAFKTRHLLGGIKVKIKYFIEISVISEISEHFFHPKLSIA